MQDCQRIAQPTQPTQPLLRRPSTHACARVAEGRTMPSDRRCGTSTCLSLVAWSRS